MSPYDNPNNAGEAISQGIPGVSILTLLRNLGQRMPDKMQEALQLLGIGQQARPQGAVNYPPQGPLPRAMGTDAQGNPIIVPPGQGGY